MDIAPQLDDFSSTLDDLETSLQPLISTALSATASKLPLLDKAKLYVLATYALESLLFSYLRLHGVEAKSHPVYQELNRVKEYFGKIKTAEEIGAGGRSGAARLDRDAANRFIKAGLSGNDRYDKERRSRQERERTGAMRKLESMGVGTHTRFDGTAKKIQDEERVAVVKADEADSEDHGGVESPRGMGARPKKRKLEKTAGQDGTGAEGEAEGKKEKKGKKKRSKHKSSEGET